jgi:hypothetical protein
MNERCWITALVLTLRPARYRALGLAGWLVARLVGQNAVR